MSPDRHARVAARLLAPAAPQAQLVAAVARHHDTATSLWRALSARGTIPARWLQPGTRTFRMVGISICDRCGGKGRTSGYSGDPDEWEDDAWTCGHCRSQGKQIGQETDYPEPPSKTIAVALAGDPEGVEAVEELAREAATRLGPWGFAEKARLTWRVGGPLPAWPWALSEQLRLFDFLQRGEREVWLSPASKAFQRRSDEVGIGAFFSQAQRHAEGDQFWRSASARGDRVRAGYEGVLGEELHPAKALVGRPFAELANPFEPLLAIWELGYVPVSMTQESIVLMVWRA